MGQPKILITFQDAARNAIKRSERGVIGMIVKDANVPAKNPVVIVGKSDIPATLSSKNKRLIENARKGYLNAANKIILYTVAPAGSEVYSEVTPNAGDNPATEGWYNYDETNHVYAPAEDTHVVSGTTYYNVAAAEASPQEGDNPATEGWYEQSGSEAYTYTLTEDTTVDSGKTYYVVTATEISNADPGDNPSTEGWYEDNAGEKVATSDTYVVADKVYYEKTTVTVLTYDPALTYFETAGVNWVIAPYASTDNMCDEIAAWVSDARENDICVKAILPNTAANSEAIVNFTTAEMGDGTNTYTTEEACARVGGILATTPLTGSNARSATYAPMEELTAATKLTKTQMDAAEEAGELIAFHDGEKVKLGRAVNSLVRTSKSDQWRKIRIVEIMDIIKTDIMKTAQDNYIGKYVASFDNKMLIVAAVKSYLNILAKDGAIEEITDADVVLDEDRIKEYLQSQGIDYSDMTDDEILHANTGSHVFIKAYISILDAVEDIELPITI